MLIKNIGIKTIKLNKYIMIISILMLTLIMSVLSFILYNDTKTEIKSQIQQSGTVEFNQYTEYIDDNFSMIEKLVSYIINDTAFHKLLNIRIENIVDKMNKKYSVDNYLLNLVKNNDVIESINIISSQTNYNYGSNLFSQEFINEIKGKPVQKKYSFNIPALDSNANSFKTTEILVNKLDGYSYIEFSFFSENLTYWNVYIIFNQKFLFRDSNDFTNIAFLDENNVVYKGSIYNQLKEEELLNNEIIETYKQKEHSLNLYTKKLIVNNMNVVYAVDASKYIQKLNVIRWWMLFICITSLMLSFGVSKVISKKISHPLQVLTKQFNIYQLNTPGPDIKVIRKKVKIKTKLFLYFVLMTIIPMIIYMTLFYMQSVNIISGIIIDSSKSIFTKISTQINRTVTNKIAMLQMLSFDENVQNFFVSPSRYVLDDVNSIVENMRYLGLERDSVSFYSNNFTKLFSDRQTIMQKNLAGNFEALKRGVVSSHNIDSIGDEFLSFSIPVISMLNGTLWGEKLGYCRIDSELYRYKNMLEPIEVFGGSAAIIDQNAKVLLYTKICVWNTDQLLQIHDEYTQITNYNNIVNYYRLIPGTGLYTIAQFNIKDIMQYSRPFLQTYIYLFLLFLSCILIISYFISLKILKPIDILNKRIKTYNLNEGNQVGERENGEFNIEEIESLSESFIKMSDRIETLVDDLIISNNEYNRIAIERKNAEMNALQAQINPHFLYNTLNNFIALIRSGYHDEAISAIKLLGSLFKYGISRKDVIIPIREELEYAKVYAELIKIRFGDRVSFLWDIQESVYNFSTIKLILQPLIENSIQHGFDVDYIKGIINIKCMEEANSIIFMVSDNGKGILPEVLTEINETLESNNYNNHIGIFNVQGRLKLHYGKSYNFEITSVLGEGTIVSIRIPKNN